MDLNIQNRSLPEGFQRGSYQGDQLIGEVTESIQKFLMDGWESDRPPPKIEEDLSFVPKDREEVIYIYMYRVARNEALINSKQWKQARFKNPDGDDAGRIYYDRHPLYLDIHYLFAVHSKFRSDAERLLGWLLLRLHDATHLIYRPRKYTLPDGRELDSMGRPWSADAEGGEELIMEKVSVALVDDLAMGDAINFFTIHEAPFRPFVTYRARGSMEGMLISAPPTTVRAGRLQSQRAGPLPAERPGGRLGRLPTRPSRNQPPGPKGHEIRPLTENDSEE